jgi:hypothetical protein
MLIELDTNTIKDKKLAKIVKNLNESDERGKPDKFGGLVQELLKYLKKHSAETNLTLFILSIVAENYPEQLPSEIYSTIHPYLETGTLKERTNSVIIVGSYMIEHHEDFKFAQVEAFLRLLLAKEPEIRLNVSYFLDQIPTSYDSPLLPHIDLFVDVLSRETKVEVITALEMILSRLQKLLSLKLLQKFVSKLTQIYEVSTSPERSDAILTLLSREIPELVQWKEKKLRKKPILNIIQNRHSLVRLTNLNVLAEQENMKVSQVEDYLLGALDPDVSYGFIYTEKNQKKMLEFEIDYLTRYISKDKRKIEEIIKDFGYVGISHSSIVAVFIQDLLRKKIIHGYLRNPYFYSWDYLLKELKRHLQHKGFVSIPDYARNLSTEVVHHLIDELSQISGLSGFFNQDRTRFQTYRSLYSEIEMTAQNQNVVDLQVMKDVVSPKIFQQLVEFCKNQSQYFTKYNHQNKWLTNLGRTRIQQMLQTCEQVGLCDLNVQTLSLGVPFSILQAVTAEYFDRKNGFWNKAKTQFSYAKYVKKQIAAIQRESDQEKSEKMIAALAHEMDIERDEIEKKVGEKLQNIAQSLAAKDEFEISPILRDLQMDYSEFLTFIDSFGKSYVVINGRVIFSPAKIQEEEKRLKTQFLAYSHQNPSMDVKQLASQMKCSTQLVLDILTRMIDGTEIAGRWLKPNDFFLTEFGILQKMQNAPGYIDLHSFLEEIPIDDDLIAYLEPLLQNLLATKALKGIYDPETKVFQSESSFGEATWQTERERFSQGITPSIEELEYSYNMLREILQSPDITPSDIDSYETIIDEQVKKILVAETAIKRMINNANGRLNKNRPRRKKSSGKGRKEEDTSRINFEDDDYIAGLMNDFKNWKQLLFAIEQKCGEIVFLKKKLKSKPDNAESKKKLDEIEQYLGFSG